MSGRERGYRQDVRGTISAWLREGERRLGRTRRMRNDHASLRSINRILDAFDSLEFVVRTPQRDT